MHLLSLQYKQKSLDPNQAVSFSIELPATALWQAESYHRTLLFARPLGLVAETATSLLWCVPGLVRSL